jgi:hypothetical protein
MIEGWGLAVAAGVSAVGAVAGSAIAAGGEKAAANTQQNMFNTIQGNEQPFIQGGEQALTGLEQLEGTQPGGFGGLPNGYLTEQFQPTMAQLAATPGYQFALQQGDQAVQNSAAASTGAVSGPALKQLASFNQGLASTQYQNSFNNFQTQQNNIFNRLSSIAGLGQNAAGNLGNNGAQLATGVAGAQAAEAGSIASGISSATGSIGQSFALNSLLGQGGSSNLGGVSAYSPLDSYVDSGTDIPGVNSLGVAAGQ